ncbi:hypothetical protein [Dokdonella sp.]|uniref:hypothetical protein n=1 Tax=Dokdonella sp. TaxID=2291710 RepID=UPI0031C2EF14|nr:hypothetical protein [Dokdonella sp.]
MKRRLYLIALVLFFASLAYDSIVWGALPGLPDIGDGIVASARREAPLASAYIALGSPLDAAVPALQAFGERHLRAALEQGFAQIGDDATAAMDVIFHTTWNSAHRWLKTAYWAPPVFLLLSLVLWTRRPRQVRAFGRR